MDAVKWLSDNSFLWTTVGRGASPAQVDPGPARLQDRRPALGCARRLRRRHVASRRWARSRSWPGPTSPSTPAATSSPRRSRASGSGQSKPEEAMAKIAGAVAEGSRRRLSRRLGERLSARATVARRRRSRIAGPIARPRPCDAAADRLGRLPLRRLLHRPVPALQHRADPLRHLCRASPSGASSARRPGSGSTTSRDGARPTSGSRIAFVNVALYALIIVPGVTVLGLALRRSSSTSAGRSSTLARTLFFTPNVVSATVIGLVWVWLLDTQFGLVNHYLGLLGIGQIPWLTSTHWSLVGVSIASIWWDLGLAFVLFLAALQDVPRELHEAAAIDGAGRLRAASGTSPCRTSGRRSAWW